MAARTYDQQFFEHIGGGSSRSARRVVPVVRSLVNVESVVDVGCGDGSWLAEFMAEGVVDVTGVDGDVPESALKIPSTRFCRADLKHSLQLSRRFDLAMSLEVAEHLSPSRAASFVADLARLSRQVLFSAAIPFQRGTHHVNCQWPDYWQDLFAAHDYVALDLLRPALWHDEDVEFWYRQNIVLFIERGYLEEQPSLHEALSRQPSRLARLVHPELCDRMDHLSLREVLRLLPAAAERAIRRRLTGTRPGMAPPSPSRRNGQPVTR